MRRTRQLGASRADLLRSPSDSACRRTDESSYPSCIIGEAAEQGVEPDGRPRTAARGLTPSRWTIGPRLGRRSSGGAGHRLSAAIVLSPVGDLRGLWRRPSWFCAEGGRHRSPELPSRSNDSAASTSVGQAARWPRPAQLCIRDHFSAGRSGVRVSAETHWPSLRRRSWATIKAPRRTRSALRR